MTVTRRPLATGIAAVVIVIVGLGLGLAGCSSEASTLDRAATERAVGRSVAAAVEPAVAATVCPTAVERAKGGRFRCEVRLTAEVGTVRASVRQVDDAGHLEVALRDAVVSGEAAAATLKASLRSGFGRSFQVDCGKGWKVRSPGDTFTCRARDKTSRRSVEATVTDPAGTLSFEVLPE